MTSGNDIAAREMNEFVEKLRSGEYSVQVLEVVDNAPIERGPRGVYRNPRKATKKSLTITV